jgi:hypothetical protein
MLRAFLIVLALVYIGGCVVLSRAVRDACTHGNCIHGWYSKYNTAEKLTFIAWALGVPATVIGVSLRIAARRKNGAVVRTDVPMARVRLLSRRSLLLPATARKE